MQPIGYPAPKSAAALVPVIVAAYDVHGLCRAMGGASGRSSSSAPTSFGMVTCNLLEIAVLCNLARNLNRSLPAHFRGFACGRFRRRTPRPLPFSSMGNTGPMLSSQRCGAKTRTGKPCMSPAVSGKKRCRMHGGAPGSGAPRGNKNALKNGLYTREAIAERKQLRTLVRQSRKLIQQIE
jgi:hypothetical protein